MGITSGYTWKDGEEKEVTFARKVNLGFSGATAINSMTIGQTTAAAGSFTTITTASGATALNASFTGTASPYIQVTDGTRITYMQAVSGTGVCRVGSLSAHDVELMRGGSVVGALITTGIQAKLAGGFLSSDNSAGISTSITSANLVGKTITVKDGIITAFA